MILLVTSATAVAEALKKLIGALGYELAVKDCADDVPQFIRSARPSLAVIDCGVQDSVELVKATRSDPFSSGTALVTFSVDDESCRQRSLAAGADAFVMKGKLDWADLLEQIRRFAGAPSKAGQADER